MKEIIKKFINILLSIILPIVLIIYGPIGGIENVWFYLIFLSWFSIGTILLISAEGI